MCLGTVLNLKLHFSLSLRECVSYMCVWPGCLEAFWVHLAHLFLRDFFNYKKSACMPSKFTTSPSLTQSKPKEMVHSRNLTNFPLADLPDPHFPSVFVHKTAKVIFRRHTVASSAYFPWGALIGHGIKSIF